MIEEEIEVCNFTCRIIRSEDIRNPIVFLHGYIYTSDIWRDINVLSYLEEKNIPFIAIDMPYGLKSMCKPKTDDVELNVKVVERIVSNNKPLLVGASLGGYIAVRYSLRNPVKGLLLISPVRCLEDDLIRSYRNLNVKTYIIYGENDKIVPFEEMKKLSDHLNAKLIVYEDAGHPAYIDKPLKFREDLIELYYSVFRNKT